MGGGLTACHCFGVVVAAVVLASVVSGEAGAAAANWMMTVLVDVVVRLFWSVAV